MSKGEGVKMKINCVDCGAVIMGEGQLLIRCDDCLFIFIVNNAKEQESLVE